VKRTWALDVADDGTGLVVHELDTALSNTTTGAYHFRQPYILSLRCPRIRLMRRLQRDISEFRVPVRPRTRVTLTSLTGALADSIMCDCRFRRESGGSVYGVAGSGVGLEESLSMRHVVGRLFVGSKIR
jgi:hypothetical protein